MVNGVVGILSGSGDIRSVMLSTVVRATRVLEVDLRARCTGDPYNTLTHIVNGAKVE